MDFWPNSLDCTDLNECGARRDAELCRLCYKQTNKPLSSPILKDIIIGIVLKGNLFVLHVVQL